MIIETNDTSLPAMDNPCEVLAWRSAYDHGFRMLTGRFKLDPVTANGMARQYAEQFWRN